MQNPVPDKLTFRSEGKMTSLYVQYCHTVTERREQLTDRTLCKSKLMWKSESSLPLFLILSMHRLFSYLTNTILLPEIVTYPQFMEFCQVRFQHSSPNQNEGLNFNWVCLKRCQNRCH